MHNQGLTVTEDVHFIVVNLTCAPYVYTQVLFYCSLGVWCSLNSSNRISEGSAPLHILSRAPPASMRPMRMAREACVLQDIRFFWMWNRKKKKAIAWPVNGILTHETPGFTITSEAEVNASESVPVEYWWNLNANWYSRTCCPSSCTHQWATSW